MKTDGFRDFHAAGSKEEKIVIEISHLVKKYGDHIAVNDLTLTVERRFFLFLSTCYLDIYIVFLQILFHLPDRLKADSVDSGFFGSLDIFHPVIDKYTLIRF